MTAFSRLKIPIPMITARTTVRAKRFRGLGTVGFTARVYAGRMSVETVARRFVAAAVIGLSIAWLIWSFNGFSLSDSDAYRLAADRLVHGQNIYVQAPNQNEAFRYAPWFEIGRASCRERV